MTEDLTDIIDTLRVRRSEHAASIVLLDKAIENLSQLVSGAPQVPFAGTELDPAVAASGAAYSGAILRRLAAGKSVKQRVLDLLNEGPKDWSAEEIIEEYDRRGEPFTVQDPRNALFSALSRLSKSGDIRRLSHGRYVAKKYGATPASEYMGDPSDGGLRLTGAFGLLGEAPSD